MIAIVNLFPFGKGDSLGAIVAEAVDVADKSGLDYRLTAMGTIIEGDWGPVMRLIKRMRDRVSKKSRRVYLTIAIDDRRILSARRRSDAGRIEAKVKSVEKRLSKKLRK